MSSGHKIFINIGVVNFIHSQKSKHYRRMIFQIVAVFVTDTEFDYVRPEFETKKERTEYLETVARKNLFAIDGAAIEDGDKLLTLSMCCTLYGKNETGDQRLVVAAKLLPTAAEEAPYAVQDAKFPELPENK